MMKKFLASIAVLALFLVSLGFASALTLSSPGVLTLNDNQTSIVLTNNDAVAQNVSLSVSNIVSGSNQVALSVAPSQINDLAVSGTSAFAVSISSVAGKFLFGDFTANLSAVGVDAGTGASVDSADAVLTFRKSFCVGGAVDNSDGELVINSVKLDSNGKDDDVWKPFDEVTVKIDVENSGSDDVEDVIVKLGLFDSEGKDVSDDLDFESAEEDKIEVGDIKDGDEETVEFKFKVPADFDEEKYKLAVKAYSDDAGEKNQCTDTSDDMDNNFYHEVEVEKEDDEGKFIAFDNIELSLNSATCGEAVNLDFDVYNIGDEDQDQVKINLVSTDLGLKLSQEIKEDFDQGDSRTMSFSFNVPENTADKKYTLRLSAEYDYRNGNYREISEKSTDVVLEVVGCSLKPAAGGSAGINALLVSDVVKAGQEFTVKVTVTNTEASARNFAVDASDYDSWASLESISSRVVNLGAGESRDVEFVFSVKSGVKGEKSFNVDVMSGTNIQSREVAVNVEPGFSLSNLSNVFAGNSLIWVIGLVNLVLIILIIFVAVRLSRK